MYVSYSSLKDFSECPYRFKLKSIDGIKPFDNSVDMVFGTLMHKCIGDYLLNKRTVKETKRYFWKIWKRFHSIYKKHLNVTKIKNLLKAGLNILSHLDTAFSGYEIVDVEEPLELPVSDKRHDIQFKGYIDLVMRKKDRIVIADMKTVGSVYMFLRFLDDARKHQLIYYKNYYAVKHGVPLGDIDIYYILLDKTVSATRPVLFLRQYDIGQAGANELINKALVAIDKNEFPKNYNACHNKNKTIVCPFFETNHCPKP